MVLAHHGRKYSEQEQAIARGLFLSAGLTVEVISSGSGRERDAHRYWAISQALVQVGRGGPDNETG